jgi:hypothetical protein
MKLSRRKICYDWRLLLWDVCTVLVALLLLSQIARAEINVPSSVEPYKPIVISVYTGWYPGRCAGAWLGNVLHRRPVARTVRGTPGIAGQSQGHTRSWHPACGCSRRTCR